MRRHLRSRQRGSALLVALIMIIVTLAMIGLLLAAPESQLRRTAASTAKERANEIADAGFRDAVMMLTTYELELKNYWATQPSTLGGTPTKIWVSGTSLPTGGNAGSTSGTPSSGTHFEGKSVVASSLPLANGQATWLTDMLPENYFTGNAAWANGAPYKEFGDPRIVRGRYAYMITPRGSNYWRIDVDGQAQESESRGRSGDKTQVSTRITAYVWKETPEVELPGAATFMNPTGGTSPSNLFNTQNGGSPPSIVGTDLNSVNNIPGVAIQTPTQGFGQGASEIQGSPAPIVGGTSGTTVDPQVWTDLDALVQRIRAAPTKTSTPILQHITYPATIPDNFIGTYHITVPADATVTTPLMTISGNNPIYGIVVIDVGPNVTFQTEPIYQKNGTSGIYGSVIFYQQGSINTDAAGLRVIAKNGNNDNFLQFSSTAVANALLAVSAGYKIVSYVMR